MNTHQSIRRRWLVAYRLARSLCWGSLWFQHGDFARLAIAAKDWTGTEVVMPAHRFKSLGYYARGKRFA